MFTGILDKLVDEDGPGAFFVIIGHVIADHVAEVEQQIPRVTRNRTFIVLLQKLAPQIEKLEATREDDIPIGDGHVQIQPLLARVLSVVEGKLVKVFELGRILDFVLHRGTLSLEPVNGVTSHVRHAGHELVASEFALRGRLELPGDDEDDLTLGIQAQILEKLEHAVRRDLFLFLGVFVFVEQRLHLLSVDGRLGVANIFVGVLKEIVCCDVKLPVMLR